MKKYRVVLLCITILLFFSLLTTPATQAALDAFVLNWWSVDSGGGQSNGSVYNLQGVAGQTDAGLLQGGDFSLAGGYLGGAAILSPTYHNLFLPLIVRP